MSTNHTDESFFISTNRAAKRLYFSSFCNQPASQLSQGKDGGFTFTREWRTGVPVDQSFTFVLFLFFAFSFFFPLLSFHFLSLFLLPASSATSLTWTHSNQVSLVGSIRSESGHGRLRVPAATRKVWKSEKTDGLQKQGKRKEKHNFHCSRAAWTFWLRCSRVH